MSPFRLSKVFLSLILGTIVLDGIADDLVSGNANAWAAARTLRWNIAQTAGTTPQTLTPAPTLGDNALELELASKYGIIGTELRILASELQSRLLTKETINRYQIGSDAAQYAALSESIYRDEGLVDFDKDGKVDWKLDPELNKKDVFTGFHGAVYVHTSRKEVVIAFEGTTPPDPANLTTLSQTLIDLLNDVAGAALSDPQTVRAEPLVKEVLAKYGKDHGIVVTGHSLGGRLAQIVAASMGLEAFTFNPATTSKATQKAVGPINPSRITNILMVSDVVNPVSKLSHLGSDLGRRVEFYFPWSGFLHEHSITTIVQRLSGVRRVYEDKIKPVLVAGQALPALPFIERDKEIDYFKGEWRLKKPFPLYAKEGDRMPIKTLPAGTNLDGLSLATHTLSYEIVEIGKPRTIEFWDFTPQGQRKSFNIPLQLGDKIAVLSYFGEGECRTWFKGRVYIAECLHADADAPVNSLMATDRYSGRTETVRWALVRTRDGLKGWLWLKHPDIEDIQGISKHGESVGE